MDGPIGDRKLRNAVDIYVVIYTHSCPLYKYFQFGWISILESFHFPIEFECSFFVDICVVTYTHSYPLYKDFQFGWISIIESFHFPIEFECSFFLFFDQGLNMFPFENLNYRVRMES